MTMYRTSQSNRLSQPTPRTLLAALVVILLLLSSLWAELSQGAKASGNVVGSGTPGSCTETALKAAVVLGGTITFNCGSSPTTITVTDDVTVSKETVIDGGGSSRGGLITISGGNTTRVFNIINGVGLTVRNLTITNGKESGSDGRGSGIRGCWRCSITVINSKLENNDGTSGNQEGGGGAIFVHASKLTVTNSAFTGNKGINGGAINNLLSALTVTNSTFVNNDSTPGGGANHGYGGAIYTDGASEYTNDALGGQIIIRGSTFSGNRGAGQGGAVFSFVYPPDTVVIENTVFSNNSVVANAKGDALGGGLRQGNGQLTLSNTTFSGNLARSQGGGFWTDGKHPASLTNVTFANNRAVGNDATGKDGLGGAIAGGGNWTCTNCTIAGNHAGFVGGGIFGGSTSGTSKVTLKNTIIANNTAFNNGNNWNKNLNCANELVNGGNNLQFPARNPAHDGTQYPDPNCTANITIANPQLAALADNGGPTQTMALTATSPAIDAGNGCPAIDQRGVARPQGSACDIGAYEVIKALQLSPGMAFGGDPEFTLMVMGANFTADSKILWNGVARTTTFVNSSTLTTKITQAEIATPATISVAVSNSDLPARSFQILVLRGRIYVPAAQR